MKKILILIIALISFHKITAQTSWQAYTRLADSLETEFKFEEVLLYRSKAIKEAKLHKKDTLVFLELLRDISINKKKFLSEKEKKKEEVYNHLIELVTTLKKANVSPKRLYHNYNQLYNFSNKINNQKDSETFIEESIEYQFKSSKVDSLLLLKSFQNSGTTYRKLGKLKKSEYMFEKALQFCERLHIKDADVLGFNYLSLSELYRYRYLDNPKKYISYLKKAEAVYEASNNTDDLIRVYLGLADFMSNTGYFNKSVNYIKKAFALYKREVKRGTKKRNIAQEIKFHNYFIEKYRTLNNEALMLSHLEKMKSLAKPEITNDYIKDLISLSHIYLVEYYEDIDSSKSLAFLDEGSRFFPKKDLYFIKEEYDMHYGKIFLNNKDYKKAITVFKNLSNKKGLPLFIAKTTLEKQIILNVKTQNINKALEGINDFLIRYYKAKENIDIKNLTYDSFQPSTVLSDTNRFLNLAKAFELISKDDIAETLYWLALKQFEFNLNKEILNDRVDKLYQDICYYFYHKISNNQLNDVGKSKFLAFTETIESKHLLNTFVNNRMEARSTGVDSLIVKEQFVRRHLTNLKKLNVDKKSDSINQLIFEDELKLEKINEELKVNPNRITSLVNTDNTFNNIKTKYIIKYKLINNSLFRLEFDKEKDVSIFEIENYNTIRDTIVETILLLKNPNSDIKKINEKSKAIFDVLLGDTAILNNKGNVTILPDDILYYLPFELLIHHNKYLLEYTTISYASTLSFIHNKEISTKALKEEKIALFAPFYKTFAPTDAQLAVRGEPYYLEGALEEVKTISKMFKNSDLYINKEATKKSFKMLSSTYDILHLSMHSFINDKDSELSSLVFSDNDNDYELYISELYGLNLNAKMAVLSACNTGVGELKTGKGIVSMNNAFIAAGVPSVLSSLWSAPDEATQKIMTTFYTYLKKGETIDVALKNAKLDYLNSIEDINLKHPYYWGGFILTGDTPSMIVPEMNYWKYVVGTAIVFLLFFFGIKKRLKTN